MEGLDINNNSKRVNILKKVIRSMICLLIGASLVILLRGSEAIGQWGDYSIASDGKTETALSYTTINCETINEVNHSIEQKNTFVYKGKTIQYLMILPEGYAQTTNQWPLIFFLHGSSARGSDLELVKKYGPPFIAEERRDFPFIVLAPQCPEGEYWTANSEIMVALLEDVLKRYPIDQERVYLTGTSMGGNGTWYLACQHPEYFAAIAPLASSPQIPKQWDARLIAMPTWAFHGGKDPICLLQDDQAMINALRTQGGTPRFTILPDQGHYIAGVYKNNELYNWFLANTRKH